MKKVAAGITSLAIVAAMAGCQAQYDNEARAIAGAEKA